MSVARYCPALAVVLALAGGGGLAGGLPAGASEGPFIGASIAAKNLDFEAGADSEGLPAGWDRSDVHRAAGGSGFEVSISTMRFNSGGASGEILWNGVGKPAPGDFGSLTQCVPPDEFRGKRVRYSGYIRTMSVMDGYAGLWMRVDGPNPGSQLGFDDMHKRGLNGTRRWTRCDVVLDVPEEATAVCFGAMLTGTGRAWVDDLAFEVVGQEVAQTATDPRVVAPTSPARPVNADFEEVAGADGVPHGWTVWGQPDAGYHVTVDAQVASRGRKSIKIVGPVDPNDAFGGLGQEVDADPLPGKRVRLSAYLRTEAVHGKGAALYLRIDDAGHRALALDNMSDRTVHGTTDWTRYEVALDVDQAAARLVVGAILEGQGTAWVDDFQLEEIGSATSAIDVKGGVTTGPLGVTD